MLELLSKHLSTLNTPGCVVAKWVGTLSKEEQEVFNKLRENSSAVKVAQLFQDISKEVELPFKLTAFRSHLRGYCTCR